MADSGGALGLVAVRLRLFLSPHRGAFQDKAMGLVDQAVENRIGKGGVADAVVPVFKGELTGHEGGAAAVAVFEDFEQVAAFAVREGREAPIVENEEVGLGEGGEELAVGAIGAGEPEIVELPA